MKYLIDQGANKEAEDRGYNTPLHKAVGWIPDNEADADAQPEVIEYLIAKGVDINAINADEETPLHVAAKEGHVKLVQYLIDQGADIHAQDIHDRKAIDIAWDEGHQGTVSILASKQYGC